MNLARVRFRKNLKKILHVIYCPYGSALMWLQSDHPEHRLMPGVKTVFPRYLQQRRRQQACSNPQALASGPASCHQRRAPRLPHRTSRSVHRFSHLLTPSVAGTLVVRRIFSLLCPQVALKSGRWYCGHKQLKTPGLRLHLVLSTCDPITQNACYNQV